MGEELLNEIKEYNKLLKELAVAVHKTMERELETMTKNAEASKGIEVWIGDFNHYQYKKEGNKEGRVNF